MARSRIAVALLALQALAAFAESAKKAPPAAMPAPKDEPGFHLIRPGDTLEGLAAKYLGSAERWRDLHKLNPRIDDPNWIYPGRRIRVLVDRPSAEPNAQIEAVSQRVEASPAPVPWLPVVAGDLLLEKDGLRTHEKSSALLRFDDGSSATVSEDSLVFIRRQTPARAPTPKKEIEIERGQADLQVAPRQGLAAPEIDVIVGDSRTAGRAGPDGVLRLRQRREGDGAQVMLYEGAGTVSGAGGSVELAPGTGTSVAKGSAPAAPRPLLPAPELVAPAEGSEFRLSTGPRFEWRAVAGADHYVIELCEDPGCGRLIDRIGDVRATSGAPKSALRRPGYWRVTAVDAGGLDGFPSRSRSYRVPLLISIQ